MRATSRGVWGSRPAATRPFGSRRSPPMTSRHPSGSPHRTISATGSSKKPR